MSNIDKSTISADQCAANVFQAACEPDQALMFGDHTLESFCSATGTPIKTVRSLWPGETDQQVLSAFATEATQHCAERLSLWLDNSESYADIAAGLEDQPEGSHPLEDISRAAAYAADKWLKNTSLRRFLLGQLALSLTSVEPHKTNPLLDQTRSSLVELIAAVTAQDGCHVRQQVSEVAEFVLFDMSMMTSLGWSDLAARTAVRHQAHTGKPTNYIDSPALGGPPMSPRALVFLANARLYFTEEPSPVALGEPTIGTSPHNPQRSFIEDHIESFVSLTDPSQLQLLQRLSGLDLHEPECGDHNQRAQEQIKHDTIQTLFDYTRESHPANLASEIETMRQAGGGVVQRVEFLVNTFLGKATKPQDQALARLELWLSIIAQDHPYATTSADFEHSVQARVLTRFFDDLQADKMISLDPSVDSRLLADITLASFHGFRLTSLFRPEVRDLMTCTTPTWFGNVNPMTFQILSCIQLCSESSSAPLLPDSLLP